MKENHFRCEASVCFQSNSCDEEIAIDRYQRASVAAGWRGVTLNYKTLRESYSLGASAHQNQHQMKLRGRHDRITFGTFD
jgi:hypothetical protein